MGREAITRYENSMPANAFQVKVNYKGMVWYDFHGGSGKT
jgi:hypothetical protein